MDLDVSEECLICTYPLDQDPPDSATDFYVGIPGNETLNSLVGDATLQCLGEHHHKYHVKCFNSFVYSQQHQRDPTKYALCMICKEGIDVNNTNKARLLNDIVIIGNVRKNDKLKSADAIKNAKKKKDILTETWLKLKSEKEYRGKLGWVEVEKQLGDVFYNKYYSNFVRIMHKWLELHRDYDPNKNALRERETAIAQIIGVDEALTDAVNKLNLLIYYINELTWDPINRRYINDDENGYGYHQYALPEDYIKELEHTGLVSGDITDETLENIINDFLVDKRDAELLKNAGAGYTGDVGHLPPTELNYVYTNVDVFDDKYNARTSDDTMSEGYGGSKSKKWYNRNKKMTIKHRIKKGLSKSKSKKSKRNRILKNVNVSKRKPSVEGLF